MRICFIGKYPPIEGGVSGENYWTVHGLAERGHQIYFVTNADEVEQRFRLTLAQADRPWYEPVFGPGFVRVLSSLIAEEKLAYIPTANPFVSKLSSIATQAIREFGCEVVVANYFEPYGVAGFLASRFTGVPLIVKHAGSDVGRLMKEPELATTYKEILKNADLVLTFPRYQERFVGFGVEPERLGLDAPFALPSKVFNPWAKPLSAEPGEYDPPTVCRPDGAEVTLGAAMSAPRVGIYGKVGEVKGSFDLIAALASLKAEALEVNLLAMTAGDDHTSRLFRTRLVESGLRDRSFILPFLPNWRVPQFLRSCSVACFLERDFPIVQHGPIVAREILACGTPLVLSREIALKQRFRDRLVHGENVWLVEDPKDHDELKAVLRTALADPLRSAAVGARGHELSAGFEDWPGFIGHWEDLLAAVIGGRGTSSVVRLPIGTVREQILHALPSLDALLGDEFAGLVQRFEDERLAAGRRNASIPAEFLRYVSAEHVPSLAADRPLLEEALRYLHLLLSVSSDPPEGHNFAFSRSDRVRGRNFSPQAVAKLRPTVSRSVVVQDFSDTVIHLLQRTSRRIGPAQGSVQLQDRVTVLFHRSQNLESREFRISEPTRELLRLCDGNNTTDDVVMGLWTRMDGSTRVELESVSASVIRALAQLRSMGVIAFQ